MYQYLSHCYSQLDQALEAVCSNTPSIDSNGSGLTCAVVSPLIQITKTNDTGTSTHTFQPTFQECKPDLAHLNEYLEQYWSLILIAFAFAYFKKAF